MKLQRLSSWAFLFFFFRWGLHEGIFMEWCVKMVCFFMLLKWKPWVSFIAKGGRLMSSGEVAAASQQLAQLPLLFKLCFRPWNTSLVEFWPCWRTLFLHWGCLLLAWICPLLLIGGLAGTMSVRELSREIVFKIKGSTWDHEDVNKWEVLGRKTITIWGKNISASYSNKAFWWERWLVQRILSEIIWLQITETHSA